MRTVVLDTGPLLEYARIKHLGEDRLDGQAILKTAADLAAFERRWKAFHRRVTVSGVIIEFHRLVRDVREPDLSGLWAHARALWAGGSPPGSTEFKIEVNDVGLLELTLEEVARFGPVDVALCEVARRRAALREEVTIVTIETRHVGWWLERSRARVVHLREFVDELE